jgi:hypothetical protein
MTDLETRDGAFRQFRVIAYLAMIVLLHSATALAATVTAATCGSTDVAKALNSARDGDTVAIPAGQCTWTANVSTSKRLTIQGAGIGQTVLIDGVSKATNPNIPQMFMWSVPDTGLSRMTGITWRGGGVVDPNNSGMIQIGGRAAQFRMDHNEFKPNGTKAVSVFGYVRGVIDHNIFDVSSGNGFGLYIFHNTWNLPGSDFGDASWAAPDTMGTAEALFVEDNTFVNNQTVRPYQWANDGWMGSRVVYRYNTYTNTLWANHGTETGGRWRSQRQFEIYNNTFSLTNGVGYPSFIGIRGGTGVIYNNTATVTAGAFINQIADLSCFRQTDLTRSYAPWGFCQGANAWDGNQDSLGYPCFDQPGRGQGGLLSGFDPTSVGWPRQAVSPIYAWNNTVNGGTAKATVVSLAPVVAEGRDFYHSVKPNYTAYQYPHPLVSTPSSEATATPAPTLSEGVSAIPPTPTATGGQPAAATPLRITTPVSSAAGASPSTTDVRPSAAIIPAGGVTSPQGVGAEPNPAAAPRREAMVPSTPTTIPPAATNARTTEPIRPESPPLRVTAISPNATATRPTGITPGPPAAAGPTPQIVLGSPGPRRNRALPVTVTSEIQLAHVKVFIDDKLVLTLATTAMKLRFSQSLPNRKAVMVRVEATDAGGNRATQRLAIPPANDVDLVAGDQGRSKASKPLARE